jgi:hypothetical protein
MERWELRAVSELAALYHSSWTPHCAHHATYQRMIRPFPPKTFLLIDLFSPIYRDLH